MSAPELIRWDVPGPYEVAFTTRAGGVSEGPYASLNLGLLTDDLPERVGENRSRLYAAAGADSGRVTWPRQVHGGLVVRANGRGELADGIWSDEPGQAMTVVTADCLPIAIARIFGERPALALVHVGWRGLLAGAISAAASLLDGDGAVLAAAVGPGIGRCCYEVGEEVARPFRGLFGLGIVHDGRVDLAGAAERALRSAGVDRVDRLDECTACNPDRFFSHRRDSGITGRQGAIGYVT